MIQEYRPLKRSTQLAPLSREHHEALLFVWKIKQGIAFGVPVQTLGKYCDWFWQNFLKPHFDKEEAALSVLLPSSDNLKDTMTDDHEAIREKIRQVIDDPSYDSLKRLAQIIYYHVRFEERHLFAHAESVHPEKLDEVSQIVVTMHENDTAWTNEFWLRKPAACPVQVQSPSSN